MALDLQKYLALFVAEANEHLVGWSRDLVALEKARPAQGAEATEAVDSLFRHAHSVKGMAASMQLEGIAVLAHRVEDLVEIVRRDPARLDPTAVDLLLAAGDALASMVEAASTGVSPPADASLLGRLAEATEAEKDKGIEGNAIYSAEPEQSDPKRDASSTQALVPRPEPCPQGSRRVEVEVEIAGGCPVPAVRAFLVVKKLQAFGSIVSSTPSEPELRAGRISERKLRVELVSSESLQVLERALSQISDLAGVVLRSPESLAPASAPLPVTKVDPDSARTVRVRTEILDGFLDAVGELILATARIREIGKNLPEANRVPLDESVDRLHAIVKDLHGKVMAVRMTPLALVTEGLPRAARDLSRKLGKEVEVVVRGAEIEIDRAILEELAEPFMHVLRNAVDHGIEAPHLRLLAGKPATGQVTVKARRERDRVIVEISDDGKGLDPEKLRQAAVGRGALLAEAASTLTDKEAFLLATLPGVSTAETVTDVSGRGVGLDAVKQAVEAIGGTLELESIPLFGTKVIFRLPLTVAVQPVLLVRVGEEIFGVPIAKVHGAAQVGLSTLDRTRGAPVLPYGGELVPVYTLEALLGFPGHNVKDERAIVVAERGDGRIGLAVDGLLGQQEAVLKPLCEPLDRVPGLSAVTVLGSGRPVFILDVPRLFPA